MSSLKMTSQQIVPHNKPDKSMLHPHHPFRHQINIYYILALIGRTWDSSASPSKYIWEHPVNARLIGHTEIIPPYFVAEGKRQIAGQKDAAKEYPIHAHVRYGLLCEKSATHLAVVADYDVRVISPTKVKVTYERCVLCTRFNRPEKACGAFGATSEVVDGVIGPLYCSDGRVVPYQALDINLFPRIARYIIPDDHATPYSPLGPQALSSRTDDTEIDSSPTFHGVYDPMTSDPAQLKPVSEATETGSRKRRRSSSTDSAASDSSTPDIHVDSSDTDLPMRLSPLIRRHRPKRADHDRPSSFKRKLPRARFDIPSASGRTSYPSASQTSSNPFSDSEDRFSDFFHGPDLSLQDDPERVDIPPSQKRMRLSDAPPALPKPCTSISNRPAPMGRPNAGGEKDKQVQVIVISDDEEEEDEGVKMEGSTSSRPSTSPSSETAAPPSSTSPSPKSISDFTQALKELRAKRTARERELAPTMSGAPELSNKPVEIKAAPPPLADTTRPRPLLFVRDEEASPAGHRLIAKQSAERAHRNLNVNALLQSMLVDTLQSSVTDSRAQPSTERPGFEERDDDEIVQLKDQLSGNIQEQEALHDLVKQLRGDRDQLEDRLKRRDEMITQLFTGSQVKDLRIHSLQTALSSVRPRHPLTAARDYDVGMPSKPLERLSAEDEVKWAELKKGYQARW